jgi:GH35 family endo-1,4-beta-xylanase
MKNLNFKLKKNNPLAIFVYSVFLLLSVCFTSSYGQTLREVAASKGKFIGNIIGNGFLNDNNTQGGNLNNIAKAEYNVLVPENALKMDALLPNRPANPFNVTINDINKSNIDKFVAYADANGMRKRGHAMIWFSQAPQWLQNESGNWTAQQVYDFSRTYITALATYTRGKIQEWDVLNEAIDDNGTANYRNAWYSKVNTQANNSGQIGYNTYFGSLFSWARAADPNVKLFYNDYSIEQIGTSKNNFMRNMVKALKNSGAPINAVGFQSHFILDNSGMSDGYIGQVGQSIDDLGASGFEVALTELDLRRCNGQGSDALQRSAFQRIVTMALSKSNCNSVLIWGLSDNNSWVPQVFGGCGNATLHNSSYGKKEAYYGVLDGLKALGVNNGGGGGGNTTAPVGQAIYLKGNNAKFVSSENGSGTGITCNRTTVGSWERFTVVNAGNGKIALKGTNGKYVSSENGTQAMRCDRATIGTSESFDWVVVNASTVQLKGNNGKFVSSENGVGSLTCNRASAGAWENFNWAQNGTAFRSGNAFETADFSFYPNPNTTNKLTLELPEGTSNIRIMDYSGRSVKDISLKGELKLDMDLDIPAGIYIIEAVNAENTKYKKLIVQ